jgi:hypothetical protein
MKFVVQRDFSFFTEGSLVIVPVQCSLSPKAATNYQFLQYLSLVGP